MKLDPEKFVTDEKFSNHCIQGFSTPECPIDKGCFAIATGFGGGFMKTCDHFKYDDKTAECKYKG